LETAKEAGIDAVEKVAEVPQSSRGYAPQGDTAHIHILLCTGARAQRDCAGRQLVGAAVACVDASAAIHECVLAIQARVPMEVLANTIHAFPSTSRIFNGLFADALAEL